VQPFYLESITVGADCAVLRIGGEVDVYTAPQLRERVIQLLANGERHIIADLREVDFLDSTGLGAPVGSLKRLREQDGSLKLVTAADRILTILRLTGLVRVFTLHSSFPEAIAGDQHWQAALAREGRSTTAAPGNGAANTNCCKPAACPAIPPHQARKPTAITASRTSRHARLQRAGAIARKPARGYRAERQEPCVTVRDRVRDPVTSLNRCPAQARHDMSPQAANGSANGKPEKPGM